MKPTSLDHALAGIGAATWLLLPIAASSSGGRLAMMWGPGESLGLFLAWSIASVIGAACSVLAWRAGPGWARRMCLGVLLSAFAVTALNFAARWFVSDDEGPAVAGRGPRVLAILFLAGLVIVVIRSSRGQFGRRIRVLMATSSVLAVPFWVGVTQLSVPGTAATGSAPVTHGHADSRCQDVNVLLFDELSNSAVFKDGTLLQPALAPLAESGRVYAHAMASTTKTISSVASDISGLPPFRVGISQSAPYFVRDDGSRGPLSEILQRQGVFRQARDLGFRTEVIGWYFPYCGVLGDLVDSCRSFSMYNAATVSSPASPWAPFVTVANMWPYQWPTGLFKRPAAAWLHRAEFDAIRELAQAPEGSGPVFRWVHFNVPHRPWLEGNGVISAGAFEGSSQRYDVQVQQVGPAVAAFIEGLRRAHRFDDAIVVLTSDHGARSGLGPDDPLWVPLIVHLPGTPARENVPGSVQVREVLNGLFSDACRASSRRP